MPSLSRCLPRAARATLTALVLLAATGCANTMSSPQNDAQASRMVAQAEAAKKEGKIADAVGLYGKAADLRPGDAAPRLEQGNALLALGNASEARRAFATVVQKDASNAQAFAGLGRADMQIGKYDSALANFEKAVSLAPSNAGTYAGYGAVFDVKGDHARAQSIYRKGLGISPDHLGLRNNLALSLAMAEDYDRAIDILKSVIARPEATPHHRANLAMVYALAGKENAARRTLTQDLRPDQIDRNVLIYNRMRQQGGSASLREALIGNAGGKTVVKADD